MNSIKESGVATATQAKSTQPNTESATLPSNATDPSTDASGFLLDLIEPEIASVENLVERIEGLSDDNLLGEIKSASQRLGAAQFLVRRGSSQAWLYQWSMGKMILAMKEKLPHGDFGKWRNENLVKANIMCERTSQRYMDLTTDHPDVRAFLEATASRLQSEPVGDTDDASEASHPKNKTSKANALLSALSGLQNKLRRFAESKEKLSADQLIQLRNVKDEIDRFYERTLADDHAPATASPAPEITLEKADGESKQEVQP
jgi:hypothetical protein